MHDHLFLFRRDNEHLKLWDLFHSTAQMKTQFKLSWSPVKFINVQQISWWIQYMTHSDCWIHVRVNVRAWQTAKEKIAIYDFYSLLSHSPHIAVALVSCKSMRCDADAAARQTAKHRIRKRGDSLTIWYQVYQVSIGECVEKNTAQNVEKFNVLRCWMSSWVVGVDGTHDMRARRQRHQKVTQWKMLIKLEISRSRSINSH